MRTPLAVLCALMLLACGEIPTEVSNRVPSGPQHSSGTDAWSCTDPSDPHCLPYVDPCPECEGVLVDNSLSFDDCTAQYINDSDSDGVDDSCEWSLARAFRPTVMMSFGDPDPSMEPYWAVKTYNEDGTRCRLYPAPCYSPIFMQVMYLFGFHRDMGLFGHWGDSEFVVLWLSYDITDGRWKTSWMFTSAHHLSFPFDYSNTYSAYEIEYPSNMRGFPRVWSSRTKHALYPNQWMCNAGGVGGLDTCNNSWDTGRLEVRRERNIGSSGSPLIETVGSAQPTLYPGHENFWYGNAFCGWSVGADVCATAYRTFLQEFGY